MKALIMLLVAAFVAVAAVAQTATTMPVGHHAMMTTASAPATAPAVKVVTTTKVEKAE